MTYTPLELDIDFPALAWQGQSAMGILWGRARVAAALLEKRRLTLATAESLTGGWLTASLTSVPGISQYFMAGFNTYSNDSKINILGVPQATIEASGAVSVEGAEARAGGAQGRGGANLGLSPTGVAGPSGGSPGKPVGLVFYAATDGQLNICQRRIFSGSRLEITLAAAITAMELLSGCLAKEGCF
jgi:PncC family amidohydrolase